jgi:hypothetical protein
MVATIEVLVFERIAVCGRVVLLGAGFSAGLDEG